MRSLTGLVLCSGFIAFAGCSDSSNGGTTPTPDLAGTGGTPDLRQSSPPDLASMGGDDLSTVPDLSPLPESMDLSVSMDMSTPPDLSVPAAPDDLTSIPDLTPTPDLAFPPCKLRCPFGCCQGEMCIPANIKTGCGINGAACAPCPQGADTCLAGACSCGNSGGLCGPGLECSGGACRCTPNSCAGCCDTNVCITQPTTARCGTGGASCAACGGGANACVNGVCQCNGNARCGTHGICDNVKGCICDNMSCGANGACSPIGLSACGKPGGGCMTCDPHTADHCDPMMGTCNCGNGPACATNYFCDPNTATCKCDPTPKTGCPGCCTANGATCVTMIGATQCGLSGSTCQNCAANGDQCNLITGSCAGCSTTCTNLNNGCCTGSTCTTIPNETVMTGCGQNGMACVPCGIGADRCVAGQCACGPNGGACPQGQQCVNGACACTAQSCPNGCCGGGTCQVIALANCALGGGQCTACDPKTADQCLSGACSCGMSGSACFAGSRCVNGACVCDAQSCPTGCCSGNVCLTIGPLACAVGGGTCKSCDPKIADTCANGQCQCGAGPTCGANTTCVAGKCVCDTNPCSTCASAAVTKSYVGCEYYPTVMANPVWSIFDFAIAIANPQTSTANITVTGPNNFNTTATVAPGSLTKVYLPWVADLKGPDNDACGGVTALTVSVVHPLGAYHVTSTIPVTVYQFNALEYQGIGGPQGKSWASCPGTVQKCQQAGGPIGCFSFSNDASLLLPVAAMTQTYRVTGQHGFTFTSIFGATPYLGSYVTVVGTQNATVVTAKIVSTGKTVTGGGLPATNGGGTLTFNVNAGDVVQVMGDKGDKVDLSGSLISATHPIEVLTGTQCINNPETASACDHIEESNFPAETFGKSYVVTVPTAPNGTPIGHNVRIYGNFNNTMLTYSIPINGAPATLQAGQVADLGTVNKDFQVTADQPFAVGSFMLGGSIVDANTQPPNQQGDPSQSLTVAAEQFRTQYIFLAPSDYNTNYADIVVPNGGSVTLDGVQIATMPTPIANTQFGVLRVKLGAGVNGAHTMTGTLPVGVQVLGYGSYTSYQYPGGLDLSSISAIPKDVN